MPRMLPILLFAALPLSACAPATATTAETILSCDALSSTSSAATCTNTNTKYSFYSCGFSPCPTRIKDSEYYRFLI